MLIDRYNRRIDYLRISVTDRCNLRCVYCMPECGIVNKPHQELLTFEEISRIVNAAAALGITRVRLTGGEPLVRKNLANLISLLSRIEGIKDISMTTNGILLKGYAHILKGAGLKRVNISLDSLRHDRYRSITRFGDLDDALEGIYEAAKAGLNPVKINVLLLEGMSRDELIKFLTLTLENSISIRFLEFMPVNSFYKMGHAASPQRIMETAAGLFTVEGAKTYGAGPAKEYRIKGGLGTFGFISPISGKFCANCNRLRLTSDGFLKLCLHSDVMVNLKGPLRNGADEGELLGLIESAVRIKPREHELDKKDAAHISEFSMCQIGG